MNDRFTIESIRKIESRDLSELEPKSTEEAKLIRDELNRRVLMIDMALKDPDKQDEHGNRLTGDDYWDWRRRATAAQAFARMRMRQLRDWIASQNKEEAGFTNYTPVLERIADALEKIAKHISYSA